MNIRKGTENTASFERLFILTFLAAILFALNLSGWLTSLQWLTVSITLITATLWVTEWLPIPVSSLIPLACFPLLGILTPAQVGQAYGSPLILLLLGGFLLSTAMSHSNTHLYIAQRILKQVGTDHPKKILLGFMLTASLLSMWISNTATTLMLLPIALAVIKSQNSIRFGTFLLLGIAYAASIGGTATPIGTPPNLVMIEIMKNSGLGEIGFVQWMRLSLPVWLIFFPLMYWVLSLNISNNQTTADSIELQPLTTEQKRVLMLFAATAIFWITRTAPFGGWKVWFDLPAANDASVALLAVVALFSIPNGKGQKLLTWEQANTIPWGILLLFAGGICIASAFKTTGLSTLLAEQLLFLKDLPLFVVILAICLTITFLTEITSNTATTVLVLPILMSASEAMGIPPVQLLLPATISASCAFMMPVATAPNAIIYASEHITMKDMIRQGWKLNVIGALLIACICTWFI
ncbi:SLC13 family permease [Marinicella rhabdoformis]|uniref:SLC13 family permease n=1 Tax=Marinicella rhabdoformis TaxID=2580566 RepID=UPI0012AECFDF|nr:SLC13 family permease [Marinicella rhabdoformis]